MRVGGCVQEPQSVRIEPNVVIQDAPLLLAHAVSEHTLHGVLELVLRHHADVVLVALLQRASIVRKSRWKSSMTNISSASIRFASGAFVSGTK